MLTPTPENLWQVEDNELKRLIEYGTFAGELKQIHFYAPSFMHYKIDSYQSRPSDFPTISITGTDCSLKCKHCNGRVLRTMYPAKSSDRLFSICERLKSEGALGCLISGGCARDGSVPVSSFIPSIAKVKQQLELTVLVHTGIIKLDTAKAMKEAGVDAALIDIIGSDETIRQVTNLQASVRNYEDSLKALRDGGLRCVPHVIVGMHYGKLRGELKALRMISRFKPESLVIIAFMPIRGTEMERVKPSRPIDIARVIAIARRMLPSTPLALGCMRPQGQHRAETDILSIKTGVNAIAFPSREAIAFAQDNGYQITFSPVCCSQIYADVLKI
jgi:uncharacterized radical SAM superfamily protein